jgi:DNA-binding beta-propeller fold protein YncE
MSSKSLTRLLLIALFSAMSIQLVCAADAPAERIVTRLFIQDLDSQAVRWSDVRRGAGGKFSMGMPQAIAGWQSLDAAKQKLVQMQKTNQWVVVGVRDLEHGKHQSGWQLISSGVSGSDHGDHSHWEYGSAPRVVDKRLDDKQGNPAHVYTYDRVFYIANDQINGYTKIDPARYNTATTPQQFAAIPRFIPGGGHHITLAVANYAVGYAGWIDGEGDHKGRVDVTRIGPNKAEIAYSFHLPSGGIHGVTVLQGRVFFAAADGLYHVPVDATASLTADQVQPVHLSLGQDEESGKPFRTGAFATLSKHVIFTIGRGDTSTLCLLNAADLKSPLVKLPLNVAAGQSASTPVVVKTHGDQRLALVFHENRGAPEGRPDGEVAGAGSAIPASETKPVPELLSIINLDPNGDKNFADARIVKTLPVGASKISGHFGHHGLDFDGDHRFAFLTNPGDGTVSILDLEKLEIVSSFKIGGTPSHIVATGGEPCDH